MSPPPIDPAKLRAAALGRQTELYRYMLDNYAVFARVIGKSAGQTDWNSIGAEIQAVGVKVGRGGKQGTRWAVRTTWAKVCADVAARNSKRKSLPMAKHPVPGIVREVTTPVGSVPAAISEPPLLTTNRPAEKKYKFGPARFRTDEEQKAYDEQQRAEEAKQLAATRWKYKPR